MNKLKKHQWKANSEIVAKIQAKDALVFIDVTRLRLTYVASVKTQYRNNGRKTCKTSLILLYLTKSIILTNQ